MAAPLRIALVAASPSFGGGERYVCDLARALSSRGCGVWVVAQRRSDAALRSRIEALCPASRIIYLPMRSLADLRSARMLSRLAERERLDVVHVNRFPDAFLALFARCLSRRPFRVVMTRHLVRPAKNNPLYRWLYRRIDRLIFVSRLARDRFLSTRPRIDPARIEVIHNSIAPYDRAADPAEELRAAHALPPQTPLLLYAGRLAPEKGVHVLLDAAARLAAYDFRLLVAGYGEREYTEALERQAATPALAGKVIFKGFVKSVQALLHGGVDIGVCPTVAPEAFGLVLLEMMQAGTAIVTTNNGAQPEFLTHGSDALLVGADDAQALARALERLLRDEALRRSLGAQARESFRAALSYERFVERVMAAYEVEPGA